MRHLAVGRHPLNCEPPLRTLMQRCWPLTPAALLYVRSHGRVPRVDAAAHCLVLRVPGGAAPRELRFSMAQLRAMPQRRVAATLVCAGNRRKEVAMVHPVSG
jgi:DMSO/TMAO reductase YedYZ molybdopterin-dependent catalytic subunit